MAKSTSSNIKIAPHHGGISVPDIEASITWYQNMLGFKVVRRMNIDAIPAKVAFLQHGNFRIELFEVPGASPLPAAWTGACGWQTVFFSLRRREREMWKASSGKMARGLG